MSASKQHWQCRAISQAGDRIRRLQAAGADPEVIRVNQREVWSQAATFLAELIGPDVHFQHQDHEWPSDFAADFLRTLRPLFPQHPKVTAVLWEEFFSELGRLSRGDEPDILRPPPRLPGQPSQPAKVANARLQALKWAAFFKVRGAMPMHYQRAIAIAFGADWDAIRHWHTSISKVLGQRRIDAGLSYAGEGYFINQLHWHETLLDTLKWDGARYRLAIGLSDELSTVVHTEWENLALSLSIHTQPIDRYQE